MSRLLTDVTARQYHARYMEIVERYAPYCGQRIGALVVTNADREDEMYRELSDLRREFD